MDEGISRGKEFLEEILEKMKTSCNIEARAEDEIVFFDIEGEDLGLLIGYHGCTLNALQQLLSIVVNKDEENRRKVILDIEKYRENRQKKLEEMAEREADKVVSRKTTVTLNPMSSYERRVIHVALADHEGVETKSEGEEPARRVVIIPKK